MIHAETLKVLDALDDEKYVKNCLVSNKKALFWSGHLKMHDGFWIYRTAQQDHHSLPNDKNMAMIDESDEGDDCAYVIGNNARNGEQFSNLFCPFLIVQSN